MKAHDSNRPSGNKEPAAPLVLLEEPALNLRQLFRYLMRRLPIIVLVAVIAAAASSAVGFFLIRPRPVHSATTKVFVSPPIDALTNLPDVQASAVLSRDYLEVFRSQNVAKKVVAKLGLDYSPDEIVEKIIASSPASTSIITVSFDSSSAQEAIQVLHEIVNFSQEYIVDVLKGDRLLILEPAYLPESDTDSPGNRGRFSSAIQGALWGGILGGLIALVVLLMKYLMNDSFAAREDILNHTGLPVLSGIPYQRNTKSFQQPGAKGKEKGTTGVPPLSQRTEAIEKDMQESFNTLCMNLSFGKPDIKTILFTSALALEGKSTVVMGSAQTLSKMGKRVCVIDANLRNPDLSGHYAASFPSEAKGKGLSDYLAGQATIKDIVHLSDLPGVHIVPSGAVPDAPFLLLQSNLFAGLLENLREDFDYVLIDSPAVGSVADAVGIAPTCDGIVLVVAQEDTPRNEVIGAKMQLEQTNKPILGVVFNKERRTRR